MGKRGGTSPAAKKRAKRTAKDYPGHLPSRTLTPSHHEWLAPFQDEYASHIGKKGAKDSAFAWVRSTIVDKFLEEWFPTLDHKTREDFRPWIGTSINSRFNNQSNSPNIVDPLAKGKIPSQAMYLWVRDNQAMVDNTWAERCMHDPRLIGNPGKRRGHVSKLWGDLTADQQLPYRQQLEELKKEFGARKVPQERRQKFFDDLLKKYSSMGREAERQASVFFQGTLGIIIDGTLEMRMVGSPLGNRFLQTEGGEAVLDLVKTFVTKSIESLERERGSDPPKAVTPICGEYMRPQIPDVTEHQPALQLLRSMVRTAINALWQLHGGIGPVPYKEITEAIAAENYSWIPRQCLPNGAPFKESGYLTVKQCLIWLKHLDQWKFDASPTDFRFAKVYCMDGESRPSHPEASSYQLATRNNKPAWIATFGAPIKHPQNLRPVSYPQTSWEYLYFLREDLVGLAHWLGLPARSASHEPTSGSISSQEAAMIDRMFANCTHGLRNVVTKLVAVTNKHESKLPAWDPEGLWKKSEGSTSVPSALPLVQPTSDRAAIHFWMDEWLSSDHFQRAKLGRELSRLDYIESWLLTHVLEHLGRHERSGTLIGGENGIAWAVRLVIKILANAAALTDDSGVIFSTPFPADCDPKRLGGNTLDLAIEWAHELTSAIEKSTSVLEESWPERCEPDEEETDPEPDAESICDDESLDDIDDALSTGAPIASGSGQPASSVDLDQTGKTRVDMELDTGAGEGEAEDSDQGEDGVDRDGKAKGKGKAKAKGKGKGRAKGGEKGEAKVKGRVREGKEAGRDGEEGSVRLEMEPGLDKPELSVKHTSDGATLEPLSDKAQQYIRQHQAVEDAWELEHQDAADKYRTQKEDIYSSYSRNGIPDDVIKSTPKERRDANTAKFDQLVNHWTDKTSMFDELPELIPSEIIELSPETLAKEIEGYMAKGDGLVKRMESASAEWTDPYDESSIDHATVTTLMRPNNYPRLIYAIALHGNLVSEARSWYKENGCLFRENIYQFFTSGMSLLKRTMTFKAEGILPDLPADALNNLRVMVWRFRHYHEYWSELEKLAVCFRNKMKDRHRHPRVEFTLEELVDIGTILQDWTSEATLLYKRQDRAMLEEWVKAGCINYTRGRPLCFSNGNPYMLSFDDATKAELEQARAELNDRHTKDTAPMATNPASPDPLEKPRRRRRPPMKNIPVESNEATLNPTEPVSRAADPAVDVTGTGTTELVIEAMVIGGDAVGQSGVGDGKQGMRDAVDEGEAGAGRGVEGKVEGKDDDGAEGGDEGGEVEAGVGIEVEETAGPQKKGRKKTQKRKLSEDSPSTPATKSKKAKTASITTTRTTRSSLTNSLPASTAARTRSATSTANTAPANQ
ncbi:hypothetical protein FRC12_024856, partial [Ceratobasidium sp. 428]